jgi:hypothetical protein
MGAVAKSSPRKCFLIYEKMRKYFGLIQYEEAVNHIWLCNRSLLNFLLYQDIFFLLFYQCILHLQEIEETREFVDEGNTMIMTMRVPGKDESVARRVFKRIANY